MTTGTPGDPLRDEAMETVPGNAGNPGPTDADGTDVADADGTDADGTDADADSKDADADGTDS